LVGFALETNDELNYAKDKLARKNLDFIVMNSLRDAGAGFGHDTNKITVVSKAGEVHESALMPKKEIAEEIFKVILKK
jgi:phosphopantothenoylcysteine decarboxylase/phosphopantothenate--cysteine ligase